jgi:hypothetical protein
MRNFAVLLATLLTLPLAANEWLAGTWIRAERKLDRAVTEAKNPAAQARLLAKRAHFLLDRSAYHQLASRSSRSWKRFLIRIRACPRTRFARCGSGRPAAIRLRIA